MSNSESLAVGGQAIIEGVMMRNKERIAAAIRTPEKKIKVQHFPFNPWSKKLPFLAWPFIRGAVSLVEILIIGMKILLWSSNQQLKKNEELTKKELFFTILFSVLFSLALFKLLPLFLASTVQSQTNTNNLVFNLVDAGLRVTLLVLYIWLISKLPDVKRLFGYHGAEHKTISCHESGRPLTVKNARAHSRFHPRCGTSFIMVVFFISVLVYLLIPLDYSFWEKLGLRILFLPIISAVSYEIIRLGGRFKNNPLTNVILAPGLALQRLTTNEPDDDQLRVAIASLKAVCQEPSKTLLAR